MTNQIVTFGQTFDMYWNDYTSFNPGATGVFYQYHGISSLSVMDVSPNEKPYLFSNTFDCKIYKIHGGLGLNYSASRADLSSQKIIKLSYSFHFNIGDDKVLGIGISPGFYHSKIDMTEVHLEGVDPTFNEGIVRNNEYGIDIGILYKSKNLAAGYSINTYLKHSTIDYNNISKVFFTYNFELLHLIYLHPGFYFKFDTKDINSHSLNTNLIISYKNRFWIGAIHKEDFNYPLDDLYFGLALGYDIIGKYRIGYLNYFDSRKYRSISNEFVFSVMID